MPNALFAADLAAVFRTDEFGTAATWETMSAPGVVLPIVVMVDAPDAIAFDDIRSTDVNVTFRTADAPNMREGDRITIDAVAYRVAELAAVEDGALSVARVVTQR